jgi:hypothetical protein
MFDILLVVGAALLLAVVVAALPLRRRAGPDLPSLEPAPPGIPDVVLVAVAAGLLTGWLGIAAVSGTWLAVRRYPRFHAWAYVAGVELLVAVAGLTWAPLKKQSWAMDWAQVWAMLAVATVSVGLLVAGTRGRGESRESPDASSSARSSA